MGKKFAVEVDQKEIDVRAELPGNNCGGCGYAGCDALAKLSLQEKLKLEHVLSVVNLLQKKIAAIMGSEVGDSKRMTAFVKCAGDCEKQKKIITTQVCRIVQLCHLFLMVVQKACTYGCMGYGSCVKACPFDAIHIVNGIAVVDKEKCKGMRQVCLLHVQDT